VIARFIIEGPPSTKKNSARILRRADGSPFIMPSKRAKSWAKAAVPQLRQQDTAPDPIDRPVNVAALVYRERAVGDLVNYLQAIADALEAAGVVRNDRLIVSWDGSRLLKDKARPRVEVVIAEAGQ
jgi:Holliday junction resolvase RusA-like endonuclease